MAYRTAGRTNLLRTLNPYGQIESFMFLEFPALLDESCRKSVKTGEIWDLRDLLDFVDLSSALKCMS